MALDAPQLPIRISKVTDRYLLFDIDDVMYLRRNHGICSPFVGTMPQAQQQNAFLGLPIELMAEEAKVLVEKKVAYVVDDSVFHPSKIASLDGPTRAAYLQTLGRDGKSAAMAARELSESKRAAQAEHVKSKGKKGKKQSSKNSVAQDGAEDLVVTASAPENTEETSLFDSPGSSTPKRAPPPAPALEAWPITSTTSGAMLDSPLEDEDTSYLVDAPPGYPLYAHLQDKGYYMMPGLRFGCDYNVYPGDPLRFHSHFQATHYGWNEEINLLDLITGGRLGTNVKKAYLIGGEVPPKDVNDKVKEGEKAPKAAGSSTSSVVPPVRAFSIEWAAM
jgi:tRNA-splicing endonuclease subunit Sen34